MFAHWVDHSSIPRYAPLFNRGQCQWPACSPSFSRDFNLLWRFSIFNFEWNGTVEWIEYRLRIHYFFSHIFNSLKNHRFHSGLESNNNNNSAFDLQCQTNYSFIECVLSVLHHLRFITPEPNSRQRVRERKKKCECIERIQKPKLAFN